MFLQSFCVANIEIVRLNGSVLLGKTVTLDRANSGPRSGGRGSF